MALSVLAVFRCSVHGSYWRMNVGPFVKTTVLFDVTVQNESHTWVAGSFLCFDEQWNCEMLGLVWVWRGTLWG